MLQKRLETFQIFFLHFCIVQNIQLKWFGLFLCRFYTLTHSKKFIDAYHYPCTCTHINATNNVHTVVQLSCDTSNSFIYLFAHPLSTTTVLTSASWYIHIDSNAHIVNVDLIWLIPCQNIVWSWSMYMMQLQLYNLYSALYPTFQC